jgi:hypothetical protein
MSFRIGVTTKPNMKPLAVVTAAVCLACFSCGSGGELSRAPEFLSALNTETLDLSTARKGLFLAGRFLGHKPLATDPFVLDREYVLGFCQFCTKGRLLIIAIS